MHVEELNRFIAEQERISKALQESEEHFRTAFDYAAIGMALVSPAGHWLRVNRSLCDIVGYSETDLLESDFQAITHEDDLGNDLAQIYRMLSGELRLPGEKRYLQGGSGSLGADKHLAGAGRAGCALAFHFSD